MFVALQKMFKPEHRFYQVIKREGDVCHVCVVPGFRTRMYIEAGVIAAHRRLKKLHLDLRIIFHR